jgi:hypothetical protein
MAGRNFCYWDFDDGADELYWQAEYQRIACGITLAQLRKLPEQELIRRYDRLMENELGSCEYTGWHLTPDDFMKELDRRGADRLNRRVFWLTMVATVAAIFSLAGGLLSAFGGDNEDHSHAPTAQTTRQPPPLVGTPMAILAMSKG